MTEQNSDIAKSLHWRKTIFPIILGLAVAGYLLIKNLNTPYFVKSTIENVGTHNWVDHNNNGIVDLGDPEDFEAQAGGEYVKKTSFDLIRSFKWTSTAFFALLGALLMVVIRDVGYMYRIRSLTRNFLSWRKSFDVIMLWEFASALTPSVVGGSGLAIFILNREGINVGRSTAIIFITALLDEAFYIIALPLVFIFLGMTSLFPATESFSFFGINSITLLFYIGYGFLIMLTVLISLALFRNPFAMKKIMGKIFSMRILKRWQKKVLKWGDELIVASSEVKQMKFSYWIKPILSTIVSWTARFFTLNFVFLIFVQGFDQLEVFGRQLVMWVILLISPTPGSSGVAEIALTEFFDYLVPLGLLAIVAVIWRLLTYFPYLFLGVFILPRWLRRTSKA